MAMRGLVRHQADTHARFTDSLTQLEARVEHLRAEHGALRVQHDLLTQEHAAMGQARGTLLQKHGALRSAFVRRTRREDKHRLASSLRQVRGEWRLLHLERQQATTFTLKKDIWQNGLRKKAQELLDTKRRHDLL